jgi:IS4 transposase
LIVEPNFAHLYLTLLQQDARCASIFQRWRRGLVPKDVDFRYLCALALHGEDYFVAEAPLRFIYDILPVALTQIVADFVVYYVKMIAPHKSNGKKAATQDGRQLRRYRRRWKIERLWAWLQNFRRILVRQEYLAENYLGFVHLGCIKILLRCF